MNEFRPPNPYLAAFRTAKRRLRWDLDRRSWRSRAALRRMAGMHAGGKAVILCNGPSLNKVDFDLLTGCFTFGLNKINLLFERVDFRPSSIVSINSRVIEQNSDFYNSTDIPIFIDWDAGKAIKSREGVIFINTNAPRGFSYDCSVYLDQGYTVTFAALQLAAYMGFRDIALIGCDHNFATSGPANATIVSGETDPNHFDPRYFAGGVSWDLPDLIQSEVSYLMAKQALANLGGRIVNCTEGGKLEVFPRMKLTDFVSG